MRIGIGWLVVVALFAAPGSAAETTSSATGSAPGFAAATDRVRIDPALRILLSHDDAEASGLLRLSQTPGTTFPLPRSVVPSGASGLDPERLEIFFELADGAELTEPGAVRFSSGLFGARVSVARLRELIASGVVRGARLSRPIKPSLDQSARYVGMDVLRRIDRPSGGITGLSGKGVVVGIVDTGLDFSHRDFEDSEGNTRVAAFWDQGAFGGKSPREYEFGVEYGRREIDLDVVTPRDLTGHGTHVTGIAAGNGRGFSGEGGVGPFVGVAPEATLIVVRSVLTDFTVAAGADYIFRRAEAMEMPAVVNLSLGSQFGPHVGKTPFERALSSIVGPGRIIVVAAGNDAHREQHAEVNLEAGETKTLEVRFPVYSRSSESLSFVALEGWFSSSDRYRFTVIDPAGDPVLVLHWGDESRSVSGERAIVRGWHLEDEGFGSVVVDLEAYFAGARASGVWKVEIEALEVADGEIDFWISNWNASSAEAPRMLNFVDVAETITVPGTAEDLITAGALVTRTCWQDASNEERCYSEDDVPGDIAFFSGLGPTSDGRIKPDILAPGYAVVSARSSVISPNVYTPEELNLLGTPHGGYWTLRGTSMATPHVTGTVALLLAKFPTLTPKQTLGRLLQRAVTREDERSEHLFPVLHAGTALLPITQLFFSEVVPDIDGLRVRWSVSKEEAEAHYVVYKGFSDAGPFHALAPSRIKGENPFEIIDLAPEPGRRHVYRISVADQFGLEEDLDTLRVDVPGSPRVLLRPVDPNPASTTTNIRFFLPPRTDGEYAVEIIDVAGRRVRALASGKFGGGGREELVTWDLRDDSGVGVASGVYWVRLIHGGARDARSDRAAVVRRAVVVR